MARLIGLRDRFDVAFACDTDHDRHGIVTRTAGLMNPNHYLAVVVAHLFAHRPGWRAEAAVGKDYVISMLPAGTMMFFRGGVTLKVDAQNGPCRIAGRSIAEHAKMADHEAASLLFPKVAKRLRGVVAWVEKPGVIAAGEEVSLKIPEQWIYRA